MEYGMSILGRITQYIIAPAILLIFSIGFLLFIWGLVVFISNPEDTSKRDVGKRHMIYGIIGMFVMIASQGIINIIIGTFDLQMPGAGFSDVRNSSSGGFPTR